MEIVRVNIWDSAKAHMVTSYSYSGYVVTSVPGDKVYSMNRSHCLILGLQFSSVQSLSCVWLFAAPWIAARHASLSITNARNLLRLMSIESVMPSSHLILCHPLLLLPPIPPSIRVFSNESALHIRWPKYWSFSFSISPSSEHPGLISFRMDWLDILAVQRTLKSLLQHHSSKALIFQCSAFFTIQLSHSYTTTGKTIALTRQTFVGKVMSLLFNMLSRLVITFLPRSKCLLISWLQSPIAVILEPPKIKSDTVSTVSPSISHLNLIVSKSGFETIPHVDLGFLAAPTVKSSPATWETWVQSLGWENPLEEGTATPSSVRSWRIPVDN